VSSPGNIGQQLIQLVGKLATLLSLCFGARIEIAGEISQRLYVPEQGHVRIDGIEVAKRTHPGVIAAQARVEASRATEATCEVFVPSR
jgi:hypothetical protein